jgi:hypothetical protein
MHIPAVFRRALSHQRNLWHTPNGPRREAVAAARGRAYFCRMTTDDIRWNDQARTKILDDSDRVLKEAVLDVARLDGEISSDRAFEELNARLKTRFIDYEPGPDIRKYADAIAAGEIDD